MGIYVCHLQFIAKPFTHKISHFGGVRMAYAIIRWDGQEAGG